MISTRQRASGDHCYSRNGNMPQKIVITPEMMEAGLLVLCGFNDNFGSYEEGVFEILTTALEAAGLEWTASHPSLAHLLR